MNSIIKMKHLFVAATFSLITVLIIPVFHRWFKNELNWKSNYSGNIPYVFNNLPIYNQYPRNHELTVSGNPSKLNLDSLLECIKLYAPDLCKDGYNENLSFQTEDKEYCIQFTEQEELSFITSQIKTLRELYQLLDEESFY